MLLTLHKGAGLADILQNSKIKQQKRVFKKKNLSVAVSDMGGILWGAAWASPSHFIPRSNIFYLLIIRGLKQISQNATCISKILDTSVVDVYKPTKWKLNGLTDMESWCSEIKFWKEYKRE